MGRLLYIRMAQSCYDRLCAPELFERLFVFPESDSNNSEKENENESLGSALFWLAKDPIPNVRFSLARFVAGTLRPDMDNADKWSVRGKEALMACIETLKGDVEDVEV